MSTDELQILEFLKTAKDFVSPKEVSKRLDRKRCFKQPGWAKQPLVHLAKAGHAESNEIGHYRYLSPEQKEQKERKRDRLHLAPHIAKALRDSGKSFDGITITLQDDDS